MTKRSRKRLVRYGLLVINLALLAVVIGFVISSPKGGEAASQSILVTGNNTASDPLDQLSSADIAVHVARLTNLAEAPAVANNADTINSQLAITSNDEQVVSKPQIVTTALKSRKDIQNYVTVNGDTISGLAARFGVTSDTIRWSNGLSNAADNLPAGKHLVIPPVNGLVYDVKPGDTVDSIAQRFHANRDQIIAFNDAEVSGIKPGERIVVPDGVISLQAPVRSSSVGYSGGFAWGGYSAVYGGNGYDYGNCTWWAAVRRAQIGRPIPSNLGNASTWKVLAQRAGLGVGNTPASGAVIWFPSRSYYGHVGFVESVNSDGSIRISEMNSVGFNVVDYRVIPASSVSAYSYIY